MKNLELHATTSTALATYSDNITHVTVHNNRIYFLQNQQLYVFAEGAVSLLCNNNILQPHFDCNTTLDFLQFANKLWFGCRNRFVCYDPIEDIFSEIPVEPFLCAVWNATEESIAVVFESGGVGTFTVDFEGCQLVCMKRCDLIDAVPQTVYVGWGSENTQFRGSEGKIKKDVQVAVEPVLDETPRISWRGNGEMFAINYWKCGERCFKVFEYPCTPIFKSENTPGLQSLIAWRQTGNMIACVVSVDNESSIVIFEKNGYKRFSFPLAYSDGTIIDIKWSPNGEILSIHQTTETTSSISLYTTSNWKWYLKQHIHYPKTKIITYDWPVSSSQNLHTIRVCDSTAIKTYTYKFTVHRNVTETHCTVGVIDGMKLLLTPFHKACVPPPMSLTEVIDAKCPINFIFLNNSKNGCFATVDSMMVFRVYDFVKEGVKLKYSFRVGSEENGYCDVDFIWKEEGYVTFGDSEESYRVVKSEGNYVTVPIKISKPPKSIDLQFTEVEYNYSTFTFVRTPQNLLLYNSSPAAKDVTSFITHNGYLLFTTSKNHLFCIHLLEEQFSKLTESQQLEDDFFTRLIEPGSTIICSIPQTSNVVLQTPRGNLEIISVRPISINILENFLIEDDWSQAIVYVRSERLNWNLLVDLNPSRFLDRVSAFVDACETPSVLNQVCLELDDGNVLKDLYKKCWIGEVSVLERKKRKVFEAILDYLFRIDYAGYIATVIVIYVQHFNIEDALVCVQDLLERAKEEAEMYDVAAEAVNTLKIYAKGEDLFKKSLSLYDLDLSRYIASSTSMDPNYYDPFITNLSTLTDPERRYRINEYLQRPHLALRYLLRTPEPDVNLILDHIRRHDLPEVLHDFIPEAIVPTVAGLLGAKLSMRTRYEEAAAIYKSAGMWLEAHRALRNCGRWEEAIECLGMARVGEEKRTEVLRAIAAELVAGRRVKEAARVYFELLGEEEEGMRVLMEGGCFREALSVGRRNCVEEQIVKALKTYCYNLVVRILETEKTYIGHRDRLQLLRKLKLEHYTNPELDFGGDQFSDLDSQTGSSRSSRYSSKSSRNRRKLERKTQDLRPGNQYENIALVRVIHSLVSETMEMATDVRQQSLVLLEMKLIEQGKCLQEAYGKVVDLMKDGMGIVWPECFKVDYDRSNDEEAAINLNIELLDDKYRTPPKYCGDEWRVLILTR